MTSCLGIVVHLYDTDVVELAKRAVHWCAGAGVDVVMPAEDAAAVGLTDVETERPFGPSIDACLSLGGDGTMLRAAALVAEDRKPILGVNGGHLGYLTEVDPEAMEEALGHWLAGELETEHRMMIDLFLVRDDGTEVLSGRALNEVVVTRSEPGRAVEVSVAINGKDFIAFIADGLIVATPTGSTAYSLSAGGPIVEPDLSALLLTPVAGHGVFNRPMVLAPDSDIQITLDGHRDAVVTLDGRSPDDPRVGANANTDSLILTEGQSIVCRVSTVEVGLLGRGDSDFHLVLKEKFGLTGR